MINQIESTMEEKWKDIDEFKRFKIILEKLETEDQVLHKLKVAHFCASSERHLPSILKYGYLPISYSCHYLANNK